MISIAVIWAAVRMQEPRIIGLVMLTMIFDFITVVVIAAAIGGVK